jgi:MoaA/NifB/PqqE/SkfB family radical SAM enzyme
MNGNISALNGKLERAANKFINFEPLIALSERLIENQDYEEARKALNTILKTDPLQTDALNNMGVVELLSGNPFVAEEFFNRLLAIDPSNEIARQNLSLVATGRRKLDLAELNMTIAELGRALYVTDNFRSFISLVDGMINLYHTGLTEYFGSDLKAKLFLAKVTNLLVSKYQYIRLHNRLLGRPFGLLVDPANGCNLHCPGCVHTPGGKYAFHWDKGILSEELFKKLLRLYAPYATHLLFFNYGEPFINKNTPKFISQAKKYRLYTSLSTNLSLPIDFEAVVKSGLDYMTLSIDGASEETYKKYRLGGRFGLVCENVKKLAEARRKLNSKTPYIVWQFLIFDHNKHEIERAKILAEELGVDEINFGVPFDVSLFDPGITIPPDAESLSGRLAFPKNSAGSNASERACFEMETEPEIEFNNWEKKFDNNSHEGFYQAGKTGACDWLYKGMAMDANGKILPCCMAPSEGKNLEFASLTGERAGLEDAFNSSMYMLARESFSSPEGYDEKIKNIPQNEIPFCRMCGGGNGSLNVKNEHLLHYLETEELFEILTRGNKILLADWS